uniref:RING-CH-type domain-containing protein n=1 Tax=Tetradesmus obliquus TaxID=3088 RepID=A0A383V3F1_TETOB|eukprot:jgi/Sobl393_1/4554/SZX59440.1
MSLCDGHKERRASGVRVSVLAEADDDLPICWICLGHSEPDRPLTHPCRCPSWCHATCVARWQLQSAGTRREKLCDFCSCELPDWKSVLTPTPAPTAPAVMNVNFDNKTYSFQVLPGADGYRQFTEAIRKAFHLPDDSELNITFTCDEPSSGSLLTLSGPGAYDAAVHCASVSAARRSTSGSGSTTDSASGSTTGEPHSHPLGGPSSAPASPTHAARQQLQQQQHALLQQHALGGDGSGSNTQQQQQLCPANLQQDAAAMHEAAASGRGDETAPAAPQHASPNRHSSSSSSSSDIISRRASSSSSSGSSSGMAPADELQSPSSTSSTEQQQQQHTIMHDVLHPLSSLFHSGAQSSRVSEAGSDEHVSSSSAAAAAAGELGRGSSSSSSISRTSVSGASSSGSSSSGGASNGSSSSSRRSQGFGRKLRDAIADMLISK